MTSIETPRGEGHALGQPIGAHRIAARTMLACGVLASLLYVTTDIVGGFRCCGTHRATAGCA